VVCFNLKTTSIPVSDRAPEETEVVIERDFLLTLVGRVSEHALVLSPAWAQVLKKEFPNSDFFLTHTP